MAASRDVGTSLRPIFETLKDMSTDKKKVARETKEEMENRHPDQDVYFRFNVQQGLEQVGLEECKEMGRVKTVTEDYLQEQWKRLGFCASQLTNSPRM